MKRKKSYGLQSIGAKLLMILVPVVAVFIVLVTLFMAFKARDVILDRAVGGLHQESRANAAEISGTITGFKQYFNSIAETLESTPYASDEELIKDFQFSLTKFEEISNGFYIGLDDKGYIDVSGWVPDGDYDPTSRDWYKDGIGKKEMTLGAPYVDADTGSPCVSMSREITLADSRHGVISCDIYLANVSESVAQFKPAGTGSAILFDGSQVIASVNKDYNGTDIADHPDDKFLTNIGSVVVNGGSKEVKEIDGNYVTFDAVGGTDWTMVSYVKKSDVLRELNGFIVISLILMALAIIIISVIMLIVTRRIIIRPVAEITDSIERIANGEFADIDVSRAANNEIGDMMRNTQSLTEKLREVVTDVKEASANLGRSSSELAETAEQISHTADDVSNAVQEIAKGATDQADTIQSANENVGMLSAAIQNVATNAEGLSSTAAGMNDASLSSVEALKDLSRNMDTMSAAVTQIQHSMDATNAAVNGVNERVDGITSIASQTNLLALNASIEAARAGEAGRGFAVVAEEIGKLATESAQTAEEIRSEMENLLRESKAAIEKSNEVSEIGNNVNTVLQNTVDRINDLIGGVNTTVDGVSTISGLSEESAASKTVIVDAMDSLSAISEENAASTQQTSASMQELNATVNILAGSAESLRGIAKQLDEDLRFFKI